MDLQKNKHDRSRVVASLEDRVTCMTLDAIIQYIGDDSWILPTKSWKSCGQRGFFFSWGMKMM